MRETLDAQEHRGIHEHRLSGKRAGDNEHQNR
jgi:hypothetical protein